MRIRCFTSVVETGKGRMALPGSLTLKPVLFASRLPLTPVRILQQYHWRQWSSANSNIVTYKCGWHWWGIPHRIPEKQSLMISLTPGKHWIYSITVRKYRNFFLRMSVCAEELFDKEKREVKVSWYSPFNMIFILLLPIENVVILTFL